MRPCFAVIRSTAVYTMLPGCRQSARSNGSFILPASLSHHRQWLATWFFGRHRRELLCHRPRIRHIEMEIRSKEPDHVVPGSVRVSGLLRCLRWQSLRLGCGDRPIEMKVPDRRRAALRGQTSARVVRPGKTHSRRRFQLDSSRRRTQHDMRYLNPSSTQSRPPTLFHVEKGQSFLIGLAEA
jgi:hypothetical protein